jgi:hypothetical protein
MDADRQIVRSVLEDERRMETLWRENETRLIKNLEEKLETAKKQQEIIVKEIMDGI